MKICSVCQRCYEDAAALCVENHGNLINERPASLEMIPNYRLESLLRRDADADIYQATHVALNQCFAVKIINRNFIAEAGEQQAAARQLFERETNAAIRLKDPNIARVYEFGTLDDGDFYLVTELLPHGQTLQEHLRHAGSLSESEAVTIAQQAAQALASAHDAGIVHRALSPANIILIRGGQKNLAVKLQNFDFGGIRQNVVAANSCEKTPIDALRYSSPEQCDAVQMADAQTDVYSLGVVLYEMLCGRSPFAAPTAAAIADRRIDEQPLSQLRFEVRALLAHIVKESLQTRAAARLQIGNFARQLRQVAQLLAPLGEIISPTARVASSPQIFADRFASEPAELATIELSSREITSLNKINTTNAVPENSIAEQSTDEKIQENTANEMPDFGKAEPIPVKKKQSNIDSFPVSSFSPELIRVYNKSAAHDSFDSKPILVRHKQAAEVAFGSRANPQSKNAAAETNPFNESAPILVKKKQFDKIVSEPKPVINENKIADAPMIEREVFTLPSETIKVVRSAETAVLDFTKYPNGNPPPRALRGNRAALVGAALAALLIAAALGVFLYNRTPQPVVSETTKDAPSVSSEPQTARPDSETGNGTPGAIPPVKRDTSGAVTETAAPAAVEKSPLTAAKRAEQKPAVNSAKQNDVVNENEPLQNQTTRQEATQTASSSEERELNSALDTFISATNSRNVEQQMSLYATKLDAYYLTRNTSQTAVRAEKNRVFAAADAVDIQTGKPAITLSPDGQRATMRFRKKYAIRQGRQSHNGEVVQELRWVKSGNGWRIVSERDVKVISR